MPIEIRGVIVPDDDQWIYEWCGVSSTCPRMVRDALAKANGAPVVVAINSSGGNVTAGQEMYTMLREYAGEVLIRIQSMAASAAAVVAMARESEISPVAQIMIHNVSAQARGDYRAMDHASEVLRNSNQALAAAFVAKTGRPEAEILELMDRETWLTAQQAVELGFADRIMSDPAKTQTEPMQLAASFGSGLLPPGMIEYAKQHLQNKNAREKAMAQYDFLLMEGKTK